MTSSILPTSFRRENRIKLLRALNVHYLVAFQPLVIPGIRLVQHFPEHFSWLYQIDRPLPRAYIVSHATYEDQPAKTLRLLSSDGFDPSQNVILDEPMAFEQTKLEAARRTSSGPRIAPLLLMPHSPGQVFSS